MDGLGGVRRNDDMTRVDLKAQADGIGATFVRVCRVDGKNNSTSLWKQNSLSALTHFHELIRLERRRTDDSKCIRIKEFN